MKVVDSGARERIKKLEKENKKLRREIKGLVREQERVEKQRERLREERDRLKQELSKARRAGKRQAAPFSKGEPQKAPKRPGRKAGPGYGRKANRKIPKKVDEEIRVPLPDNCPQCGGGDFGDCHEKDQYQTEIVRKTRVTRFRVGIGNCVQCGIRVQGRHPKQTSDALGAASSQVGPEAISLATVLNKQLGIPMGKTTSVLEQGFGLSITPGGLSQALARVGQKCEPTYDSLVQEVRASPWVTMDETGWKVGGYKWWLWVAVSEQTTVYGILPGRGYEEALTLVGADFDGVLVHDGWRPYYRFESAFHQSCNRHLINRCNGMIDVASPGGKVFPSHVNQILCTGLDLRDRFAEGAISQHGLAVATGRLKSQMKELLDRKYRLPDNIRLAKHLTHEYDYLFTYLKFHGLEATNWRGEQAIRPAVTTRKVWGGNRTNNGARTQEVTASVLRTSHQRGIQPVPLIADLLRSPQPYVLQLVPQNSSPD